MTVKNELLLRPAMSYAILKILPTVLLSFVFLLLAWCLSPYFLFFSFAMLCAAWYRLLYIRSFDYLISAEMICFTRGIFFKRTDQLEMYRIKDHITMQPLIFRPLGLMDLTLKSVHSGDPVICLSGSRCRTSWKRSGSEFSRPAKRSYL